MPKEQVVIERFRGVVQSADSRDVDLQVASHMEDIDPISKRGELRGRKGDSELNSTAVATDVITLFRDGTEAVIWDGTNIKHLTAVNTNPAASGVTSAPTSSGTASMASDGTSVRVGLGNGATHIPQWVGNIEHDQFNSLVGPPSGTTHIRDAWLDMAYDHYGTGASTTENEATAANLTVWPEGTDPVYYISLEYDNFQHGPATIYTSTSNSTSATGFGLASVDITISIDPTGFPERVTAINLWRVNYISSSGSPGGPMVLSQRIGMDDTGWAFSSPDYNIDVTDAGEELGTWEDITGLPEYPGPPPSLVSDQKVLYQYNTMANGYHIVGKVWHNELTQTDNWLFRSLRNRPDMFNWAEDYLVLPAELTHLEYFAGRVYAFTEGITFRINPETFDIEDVMPGIGLSGPESCIVTERGMFFCNTNNLWFHDGTQIHTIGHPILDNDYDTTLSWNGASHGINPIVTYDGSKDLFIALFESASSTYHGFAFHPPSNEWYIYGFDETGSGAPTVGFVTIDAKPIIVFGGNYIHIGGSSTRKSWKWVSKEINHGVESVIPYNLFIEGDAYTVSVREEHDTPYTYFLANNTNYDGYMHRIRINSQVRGVDSATSWGRHNKVRLELNGEAADTVNALGIKMRRVKLREGTDAGGGGGGITPIDGPSAPDTIWWVNDSTTDSVYKATIDTWTPTLVGSADTSHAINELQVDPTAGLIITNEYSAPTGYIRTRDLSWGSKTTIVTWTGSTEFVYTMCIHRGLQRIFYIQKRTSGGVYDIKRCEYDGSNVTVLHTVSTGSHGKCISIDQNGDTIYWQHSINPTSELRKFVISTSTESTLNSSFPLGFSGDPEEAVMDEDAGTVGKIWFAHQIPATSNGIYVVDLATPTSTSLLTPTVPAHYQAVGRDRVNDKIYYAMDTSYDDIYRMNGDGTSGELVITSSTGNPVLAIDMGTD